MKDIEIEDADGDILELRGAPDGEVVICVSPKLPERRSAAVRLDLPRAMRLMGALSTWIGERITPLEEALRDAAEKAPESNEGGPPYRCAGVACPGLPWKASEMAHPESCCADVAVYRPGERTIAEMSREDIRAEIATLLPDVSAEDIRRIESGGIGPWPGNAATVSGKRARELYAFLRAMGPT